MHTTPGPPPSSSGRRCRALAIAATTLFACALPLLVGATHAAPASAAGRATTDGRLTGIGIRLVDAPADARDDPRARLYIVDHLAPGTVVSRRVEVSNGTGAPADIALYGAAATISVGSFVGAEGHTANALSSWTSVTPGRLRLAAGDRATATVTIAVPAAAVAGERYAIVWAEVRSARDAAEGVVQVSRVGVRLYVSVGPGGAPATRFQIVQISPRRQAGHPVVSILVRNTGGRAIDPRGELLLADGPASLSAGPFSATSSTTLRPGGEGDVTVTLGTDVPAGPWTAHVTLTSGETTVEARARITFPIGRDGTGPAAQAEPESSGSSTVWIFVGGGLATLVLLTLLIARRRRRAAHAPSGTERPAGMGSAAPSATSARP